MTEHVEFRDYQPQDVTKISFGSPGSFAERMDMVGSVGRVAVWRGEIVGYAVTWLALVHRTRRFVEVEVAPNSRGHQIGTRLLDQVAEASDRPLAVKAIEGSDVEEFYLERGARPYAVCPPLELPRRSFEKVVNRLGSVDDVVAGSTLAPGTVELLWSQIYTWTHEEWSPVDDSDEARAAIASEARELDLDVLPSPSSTGNQPPSPSSSTIRGRRPSVPSPCDGTPLTPTRPSPGPSPGSCGTLMVARNTDWPSTVTSPTRISGRWRAGSAWKGHA